MDILYLVDRLENLIATSRRMPLMTQVIVKEGDILNIVEQMRTTIPDEIKQARRIIQDKERILAQAQAEASTLLARAHEESERAMNREGLLLAAEERSQDMVRRATEHARVVVRQAEEHTERLKIDADAYVAETLHNLKEHLMSVETEVGRTILSIERGLESISAQQNSAQSLDYTEYENEGDELAEMRKEEQTAHPAPRRSSLANDTIGGPTFL